MRTGLVKKQITDVNGHIKTVWVRPAEVKTINTKAFKEWFKGSKIVDDKGQPLVLFHGTKADFDNFKSEKYQDKLIYVTINPKFAAEWIYRDDKEWYKSRPEVERTDVEAAHRENRLANNQEMDRLVEKYGWDKLFPKEGEPPKEYVEFEKKQEKQREAQYQSFNNIMPIYVASKKPFDPKADWSKVKKDIAPILKEAGFPEVEKDFVAFGQYNYFFWERKAVVDKLKELGYDSMWLKESTADDVPQTLAVFQPNQIKSATGNKGTYDPKTTDITKGDS